MHPDSLMLSHLLRRVVFAAFFLSALWSGHAQPASGGIEGRVFNAATGDALVNARVAVIGTDRVAVADGAGFYRLTGVPVGEAR